MGLRRLWAAAVAAVVLGMVGSACQPSKPQMELDLDINPTGTFEVLTERITLNVTLGCTRLTAVNLTAMAVVAGISRIELVDESGDRELSFDCRGPGYATNHRLVWRVPEGRSVKLDPLTVTMTVVTTALGVIAPIDYDVDITTQAVDITRILCWPLPTTCAPV